MEYTPSLSEQTYSKTGAAAPITTQPTPGAGRSFIQGVSMPANANAAHQSGASSLRMRGGGAAKDCCIGLLATFICSECCEGTCDVIADILCCPCEVMGC